MPDDDKEKRNKTRKERDPRVPPTGAKTNSAVEPDASYELESGVEIDEDDGALEDKVKKAGVPPTGAKTNSAVEPDASYELDIAEDADEDEDE